MEETQQELQFVSMKDMTHKQLATIVTHMTGRGMSATFTNDENMRNWARYYAETKRPWHPLPDPPKKKSERS